MDTTAPAESASAGTPAELLEQLENIDASEAPPVADDLARLLAQRMEGTAPEPARLPEVDFDHEVDR